MEGSKGPRGVVAKKWGGGWGKGQLVVPERGEEGRRGS